MRHYVVVQPFEHCSCFHGKHTRANGILITPIGCQSFIVNESMPRSGACFELFCFESNARMSVLIVFTFSTLPYRLFGDKL